jgi:hypothetical protein
MSQHPYHYFFEPPELEDNNNNNNYGINNNMRRDVYSPPLTNEQMAVFYHRQTSQAQPSMFGFDNAAAVASINRKLDRLINMVNATAFKINRFGIGTNKS